MDRDQEAKRPSWWKMSRHEAGLEHWVGPQFDGQPHGMMRTPPSANDEGRGLVIHLLGLHLRGSA